MGKPYARELENISETYHWAAKTSIIKLTKFMKKSIKTPLYVIGSGGSFSVTTFASLLHQQMGFMAKCLTPLEFIEYENINKNCSILIITAGGNNTDILSVFEKSVQINPKNICIISTSTKNKLITKASQIKNVIIHAEKLVTGKDGFLATNSLIATMVWLYRAHINAHSLPYDIPNLNTLVYNGKTNYEFEKELMKKLKDCAKKETIVCLYDNWGKTAAIDLESKLVEAGLINVHLADYRNFAHGRHNWLDKHKEKTCLLTIINPDCEKLAHNTLKLIPDYIPKITISTNNDGPIGSIALVIQILYIVKFFGKNRKIDPGRPGVANFGRKIYHLSIPKNNTNTLSNFEKIAIRKKFDHCSMNNYQTKIRIKYLHNFLKKLSSVKIKSIVFDYDGTLINSESRSSYPSKNIEKHLIQILKNDVIIGIATGRGKSVRNALQKIIPKKYWSQVIIGYYNGSDIGYLDNSYIPRREQHTDLKLLDVFKILEQQNILSKDTHVTFRNKQITLEDVTFDVTQMIQMIQNVSPTKLKNIKIVESSHSIDLLSQDVSKLQLVYTIKNKIPKNYEILCIGDKGGLLGNDYDLLSYPHSLSVDNVSTDPNSCWNLLHNNEIGVTGTIKYLNFLKFMDDSYKFDYEAIEAV